MKTLLIVPVLIAALFLSSFRGPAAMASSEFTGSNPVSYEGKVTGWTVLADGTVAVRLDGMRNDKEFSLWFKTPRSRTSTTSYEDLVLAAVLQVLGPLNKQHVTIVSDGGSDDSGKSIESARELNSIGQL